MERPGTGQRRVKAEEIRRAHHAATAADYDRMHVAEGDSHYVALADAEAIARAHNVINILDGLPVLPPPDELRDLPLNELQLAARDAH